MGLDAKKEMSNEEALAREAFPELYARIEHLEAVVAQQQGLIKYLQTELQQIRTVATVRPYTPGEWVQAVRKKY